jgi:riboflavin synthase
VFTGIITHKAVITQIHEQGTNKDFWLESSVTPLLRIDQSVAHNGVCLTVVEISGDAYRVTAIAETLAKTTLDNWQIGDYVNIELSLRVGDRLDGHFVQGHVDATATCVGKETMDGSWLFTFTYPEQFASLVIEKGSVCVNGVSLTAFNAIGNHFSVAIIPYTYEHTNFMAIEPGKKVNIEFDVLGKYLMRHQEVFSVKN